MTPTALEFKARFPEFTSVSDTLVNMVIGEASNAVGEGWIEHDIPVAINYLTAHMLSMEGEPERSNTIASGGTVNNAQSGPVQSMKVGDVQVTYAGRNSSMISNVSDGTGAATKEYSKTGYGAQYLALLKKNTPSPRTV